MLDCCCSGAQHKQLFCVNWSLNSAFAAHIVRRSYQYDFSCLLVCLCRSQICQIAYRIKKTKATEICRYTRRSAQLNSTSARTWTPTKAHVLTFIHRESARKMSILYWQWSSRCWMVDIPLYCAIKLTHKRWNGKLCDLQVSQGSFFLVVMGEGIFFPEHFVLRATTHGRTELKANTRADVFFYAHIL